MPGEENGEGSAVVLKGHLWTIGPRLMASLRRGSRNGRPTGRPWSLVVPDERWGEVRLTGTLSERPGTREAVVLVHGLGGCHESHYMGPMVAALERAGLATLRLNLRGSDHSGEDFYHGGLWKDLALACACPELRDCDRLFVVGFSLGGHVALRAAVEGLGPRVAAVAAICSPLELAPAQESFDRPRGWLYRQYVLRRLRRIWRPVAERRELETSWEAIRRVRTIRGWDEVTVVPRFGFRDVDDYYERASVGPRLSRLAVPSLLVAAREDPMVSRDAVEPAAERASGSLDVRWADRGGHVGFPAGLDLGVPGERGLEGQVVSWLEAVG